MKPAHLPCKRGKTFEDFHGARALETDGVKLWLEHVRQVAKDLSSALEAEYVVPGSGNAPLLRELLPKVRLGSNEHAFDGEPSFSGRSLKLTPQR